MKYVTSCRHFHPLPPPARLSHVPPLHRQVQCLQMKVIICPLPVLNRVPSNGDDYWNTTPSVDKWDLINSFMFIANLQEVIRELAASAAVASGKRQRHE